MAVASMGNKVVVVDDKLVVEYESFVQLSNAGHYFRDDCLAWGFAFEDEQKLRAVDRHLMNLARKLRKYLDIVYAEEIPFR